MTDNDETQAVRARVRAAVVGREREVDLLLAAVAARRDALLEGPPGTSKSTLLRAIAGQWDIPLVLVEGNADLTAGKLIGYHDPARVLREGYTPETFVDGPLLSAMRAGAFLYFEELNRAPEDTLNTLLTAMSEREISVPRVGTVRALTSFRIVASMNPYDNVGTTRLPRSVQDRLCRISIGYQDAAAERDIVCLRTTAPVHLVNDAVALTRATREHPALRQGSSVRGAIDLALVAVELLMLRAVAPRDDAGYGFALHDATLVALSGRVQLDETSELTVEEVLSDIWSAQFGVALAVAPG